MLNYVDIHRDLYVGCAVMNLLSENLRCDVFIERLLLFILAYISIF